MKNLKKLFAGLESKGEEAAEKKATKGNPKLYAKFEKGEPKPFAGGGKVRGTGAATKKLRFTRAG